MRRIAWWLVAHVPLGPLAPWVMGLAMGRCPNKQERKIRVEAGGEVSRHSGRCGWDVPVGKITCRACLREEIERLRDELDRTCKAFGKANEGCCKAQEEVKRLRWERDLHEARADRLGWEKARMREQFGIQPGDLQKILDDLWAKREGR